MVACDRFSICGFIAKLREIYPENFWPFSEESMGDQSVPKSRWWSCPSCTRNIDADGTDDTGLPSNSTSIMSRNGCNGSSPVIPSQSKPNSTTAIDQERERNTDHIAENTVVENEDVNCVRSQNDDRVNAAVENETVNCERSQQDDKTGNAVVENEDVNCARSQKDDQGGNAVMVNEDVNCERSQKNDQRVTRSSKKVHPPPFRTYALRNKSKRVAVPEPVGNKRAENEQNVEQLALTILASAVVENAQPKESESRSLFIGGFPCRKTRKVRTRRLKDLTDTPVINTRREETSSQKESVRGKKRKSRPGSRKVSTGGEISGSVFFSVDTEQGGSEPTDSGPEIDPIKGKKKNVRFQVDDDEVEQEEDVPAIDADPYPQMARRTMKVKKYKKRRSSKKASSSLQTIIEETETVPSPPRDQRTEERVGNSLDDQLASDGYVRKPNPQVNETQDNSRKRSRYVVASYVPVFGNSSIPKTGRGLGTGPGAIYFGSSSNNNDNNQRSTPPSTVVADQSSVPHKDAPVSDRKGKGVMVQSDDERENTQNDDLPNKEVDVRNLPQEVPPKPNNPLPFDLNETYEEDVPSLEDNTNAEREEEDSIPVRSELNSVEIRPPRQNSYMHSPSVMMPPPVQESRRSSILFPRHNPQWMGNVPMTTTHHHHYHHPYPSPYQVVGVPHQYSATSPPVWATSMIPPQCHHHSPPPPFNMDYSSMFAQQAQSSDTWNNLSYSEASLMNQAMMSRMDPRFRSNTPVNHHGNSFFTPRHVAPVNHFNPPVNHFNSPVNQFNPPVSQFSQLVEVQRNHERPVFPRTISNRGRFQQRRNVASSSNVSALHAENSSVSSSCIVSRYPGEISDIEPGNGYMVREEDLHVLERMAEFEQQLGPVAESG